MRQLSVPVKLAILWFVLKVRARRKIHNLKSKFLKLRLITAAVCFLLPKVESITQIFALTSEETVVMILDITLGTMIAYLLLRVIGFP